MLNARLLRFSLFLVALTVCRPFPADAQSPTVAADPVVTDPVVAAGEAPPTFRSAPFLSNGERVNAIMYRAGGSGRHPTVVLLHGYPGNEQNLDVAQAIRRAGINVFYFHYRGLWGSGGKFTFAGAQRDVAAAVAFLRDTVVSKALGVDTTRIGLVGHSMGAWLAILGAQADERVQCVGAFELANMAAYGNPAIGTRQDLIEFLGQDAVPGGPVNGDPSFLADELLTNVETWDPAAKSASIAGRSVLLLDRVGNTSHASFLSAMQGAHARKLTVLEWTTDHSFSAKRIALSSAIVNWLKSSCGY